MKRVLLCSGMLIVGAFVLAHLGCKSKQSITLSGKDNIPVAYVDADGTHQTAKRDTLHNPAPHMLMTGGAITLNDKCPVRKATLNLRLQTLFVNGRPVGFC